MTCTDHRRHTQPALGVRLERWIEAIEARSVAGSIRAITLGTGLGIATVTGGIGMFLLVWFLLVDVLR
jgi:hypothetical protein